MSYYVIYEVVNVKNLIFYVKKIILVTDRVVQNPVSGCYAITKQPSTATPIVQFYSIEIYDKQNRFPFIFELGMYLC
jgi:hypothetical protein